MSRLQWMLLVFSLALLNGCRFVRGGEHEAEPAMGSSSQAAVSQDPWSRGELPASMTDGEPQRGGRVAVVIGSDPPSLNTIVDSEWWAARITEHHIYQALVGNDPYDHPKYSVRPELAERWEISDDKKTYTFHLRHGVRWHDGKPLTSRDVIATFDKVQDPKTKAAHIRAYTKELLSYEALDEFTVRFTFKDAYFLVMDGVFAAIPIQPAHRLAKLSATQYNEAATNSLNRAPIGTGPFRFVEWESGQKIVIARNDDYWGRPAYLEQITFRIVSDAKVALQLAEREEVDVLGTSPEYWRNMHATTLRQKYYRSKYYDNNYAWIGWNLRRPMFQDRRVRRALTMLIDLPGIIDSMMYGLPKPTTCHFYWASQACDPSVTPLPYDPRAAVEMLEQAGWLDRNDDGVREKDGVDFRFSFMIPAGSEGAARMGTKIKEDFRRASLDLELNRVEWSAFTRRLREKDFDSCTLAWGGSTPRDDPSQIWHSTSIDKGSNYISFSNPRADAIMDRARGLLDGDQRDALYRELHRLLYHEQPYTWLYVRPRLSLIHRRLKNVRESLLFWQFEDWWIAPQASR